MREFYETKQDRVNEETIISPVADKWRCTAHKLPHSYFVDYALLRGTEIAALAEVKKRNLSIRQYREIMVSANKLRHGLELSNDFGVPFFFVISCDEGVFYTKVREGYRLELRGRTKQTRDSQDIEPVRWIPTEEFKPI